MVAFSVEGSNHQGQVAEVHVHSRDGHPALLTLTRNFIVLERSVIPFLNDTKGNALNQNVAFSGNPTVIHAGVNSGALLTGTTDGSSTTDHLIDSGESFSGIAVGMSVKNTTSNNEYALITNVAANDLTLDNDIFLTSENYEINPIWVGSALSGTWNFASGGKITITGADNNDTALFDNDTNQQWDVSNFTALTGKIDLDTYNFVNNDVLINFNLNGVQVGDSIRLNDFIDVGDFAEQLFTIPIGSFNFLTSFVNEFEIIIERTGGAKPTIKFDDIQFEEIGTPLVYSVAPLPGQIFHVSRLVFNLIDDDFTGLVTVANGTESHGFPGLSPSKLLGVSSLTNGILFQRIQNKRITFSVNFRNIGDMLGVGSDITNTISDGTGTQVTLEAAFFNNPIVLRGDHGDQLTLTINDDLTGLSTFTVLASGDVEI